MADKIRGITIELGGDASGLEQALKSVNSEISNTQKQLKDVERLLKLDPTNTELLAQKQKLLGDQIKNTENKLETLKKTQATMDENGVDKNSDQYMALQREIISTEREVTNLEEAAKKTSDAINGVANATEEVATKSQKMAESVQKVADGAGKIAEKTKGLSIAAGGALTAIGGLTYKTVQSADELATLAKQTGFSVEELQKFQYASELVDVSVSDMTGAATKLKKAVGADSKELAQLGVKTRNADGSMRDINSVFYDTLAALGDVKGETERDVLAMAIFGRSADSLAGIIDDGGASLKALGKEAEDMGLIMSDETVTSMNAVNDQIDRLKAQATATLMQEGAKAMEALMPLFEKLVEVITNVITWIGSLDESQLQFIVTVLALVAAISPIASIISKIGMALTWLMANPVALAIAGIIALVVIIATQGDKIKEILNKLDTWLQGVFTKDWTEVFGPVLGGILNGFFDTVSVVWDSVKGVLTGIIDFIQGAFKGDWTKAWNAVKSIFSSIMSGLSKVFKTPLNSVIGMINNIIDGINWLIGNINSLGSILGINIGTIGHLPMLAQGGVLKSGSAIVGEAGAEMLTMVNGKAVVQPLSNSPTGTAEPTTIIVQSVLDGRVIAESTTKYQGRMARANG